MLLLLADSKLHKLETGTLAFKVKVATFDKHQLLQLLQSLFLIFITLFALFTTALEQLLLFTDKTFSMQARGSYISDQSDCKNVFLCGTFFAMGFTL